MTDRIDHAAVARRLMDLTGEGYVVHDGWTETTALMATLDAQTHATLALVEQQRIANQIALATLTYELEDAHDAIGQQALRGLPDIAAALGVAALDGGE